MFSGEDPLGLDVDYYLSRSSQFTQVPLKTVEEKVIRLFLDNFSLKISKCNLKSKSTLL